MTCFLEPERGWLFSGDLYISGRTRYLRADESVADTIDSLRRFLEVDFGTLFCSHRGPIADGKEAREFDGQEYVMERGLKADFALIKCLRADTYGNLTYNKTARNFSPPMAMAGAVTVVQAAEVVAPGAIDPEVVVTPGIFVDRVVQVEDPAHESELVAAGVSYP